jgi:hypothetical protein
MIYSKFGSKLTLISKSESEGGRVTVQATADGTTDIHEYNVADLKADDGMNEITAVVAKLPLKVVSVDNGDR